MEPFVKWIEKKRGLAESWLMELARVALAYLAVIDWRINPETPLRIGWQPLTEAGRSAAAGYGDVGARRGGDRRRRGAAGVVVKSLTQRREVRNESRKAGQTHRSAPTS